MTPERQKQMWMKFGELISKSSNLCPRSQGSQRSAKGMSPYAVPPDVAVIVRGCMRAVAPEIARLEAEIAELRERIDDLA